MSSSMVSRRRLMAVGGGLVTLAAFPRTSFGFDCTLPGTAPSQSVSGGDALRELLADINNGSSSVRDIICQPGTYSGSFNLTRNGECSMPIRIRAASIQGTTIVGDMSLNGAYNYLYGLKFSGGSLSVGGDQARILRCRFTNNTDLQSIQVEVTGLDCEIGYCEVDTSKGRGISLDVANGCRNAYVFRCYFHDFNAAVNDQTFEALQIGQSNNASDILANCIVEYCLFERINVNAQGEVLNKENECISVKSSKNTVRHCQLNNSRAISIRHGENNLVYGCRVNGGHPGLIVLDRNNAVSDCHVQNRVLLQAGDVDPDAQGGAWYDVNDANYPAAGNTKVIRVTTGTSNGVKIGYQEDNTRGVRVDNTRYFPSGLSKELLHQKNTSYDASLSDDYPVVTPVTLTPSDVGTGYDL